jgi:Putative zinc-finger/FecR protein
MFSKHVTKKISAYCHGELTPEESRQFAEHIIGCDKCRAQFENIKVGIKLAEQLPQLSAPQGLWRNIELKFDSTPARQPTGFRFFGHWQAQVAAIAAAVLLIAGFGIWWMRVDQKPVKKTASWEVQRLNGTPRIDSTSVENKGQLAIGQWLETDGNSRAQLAVSSIGRVEIEANTRVRLLQTEPTEHRLELARGKMSARIWAPPRLFFVDTPSAVAADIGCAYTLEVDDTGGSLLRVTSGWVALELKDRESMVPAGAACRTRPGVGPGTPYFEDAVPEFRESLATIDFGTEPSARKSAFDQMLNHSRPRDTLTLWHLLPRVDENERAKVYATMASFVPPPAGVTREGVLKLDQKMLDLWRDQLEPSWTVNTDIKKQIAEAYWRVKNGLNRRADNMHRKPFKQ